MELDLQPTGPHQWIGADPILGFGKRFGFQDADATNLAARLEGIQEWSAQYQFTFLAEPLEVAEMCRLKSVYVGG